MTSRSVSSSRCSRLVMEHRYEVPTCLAIEPVSPPCAWSSRLRTRNAGRCNPQLGSTVLRVHTKVALDGRDRPRLERLCRYIARPPLAQDRLSRLPDGRLRYTMKKPWSDGTTAVLFEPLDFIARLVALIPPPRFHMLRFVGVLAPHCLVRNKVVPKPISSTPQPPVQLSLFGPAKVPLAVLNKPLDEPVTVGRRRWACLLRHVFAVDVTVCPHCQRAMKITDVATTVTSIDRLLGRYGLSELARAPPARAGSAQLTLRLPRPAR